MSIAVIMPNRDPGDLVRALTRLAPDIPVQRWPDIADPGSVRLAVAWQQSEGALDGLPNLAAVTSFGAGVDGLIGDRRLPQGVAVGRIVYPGLVAQMSEYVMAAVLAHRRGLWQYHEDQRDRRWQPRFAGAGGVAGILGLGELGADSARKLAAIGFDVLGWSRTPKSLDGVESLSGEEGLRELAGRADVLVCLLPLTASTRGILNAALFRHAKAGCFLVSAARGDHLVEADLIEALDAGRLSGACLDVFGLEPLPGNHPFWAHRKIHVTPHVASMTDPEAAAAHVVEDYRRVETGEPLQHPVDVERGY